METTPSNRVGNLLGAVRAEADARMLDEAFVETIDYRSLVHTHDFNYVVGRRGTGKSALFNKTQTFFSNNSNVYLAAFTPREHQTLELQALLLELGVDYRSARAIMRLAWKIDILLTAADAASSHRKSSRGAEAGYIQLYKESHKSSLIVAAGAQRCAAILRDYRHAALSPAELPGRIAIDLRLSWLEDNVRSMLTSTRRTAIVLWDGLDEGWVPSQASTAVLGGLAAAVSDLADSNIGIYGVLYIRDNMFRALSHFDGDFSRHIEGNTLHLNWDEPSLLHLVTSRLRVALALRELESDIKVWNRFAERRLRDREGFNFCLGHTLYRPRDILVLLNRAYVAATRTGRQQIVEDDIEATAQSISSDRLDDLLKEYDTVLPGLTLFAQAFRNQPAFDRFARVVSFLDEAIAKDQYETRAASDFALFGSGREAFLALYSVGFIGLRDSADGHFHFCHDGAPGDLQHIVDDTEVAVHPCYWRALSLSVDPEIAASGIVIGTDDEFEGEGVLRESTSRTAHVRDLRTKRVGQVLEEIPKIPIGQPGAQAFEDWVQRAIRVLFAGKLSNVQFKPNVGNVQQRDIVATNVAQSGFWRRIFEDYETRQVLFEVKNYVELGRDDFRQILSYTSGPYGRLGIVINRSENEGLTDRERSWLQEIWHEHKRLVFILPISIVRRCISKLRTLKKHDYADGALSKRLDTFERSYVAIKHSR